MEFPRPKRDVSLSEYVYQVVYKQIVKGNLKPGEKIAEARLAESMGISRAPIREALKRLAEDRLVVLIPRSSCHVADPSPEEIAEIYEIRKRLEVMALEYAFDHLDHKTVEGLSKEFERCQRMSPPQFAKKEVQLDVEFHSLLAERSGCRTLQDMLGKLRARVQKFRVQEADSSERAKEALREHAWIIDRILAVDKAGALEALSDHIEHTKENVLRDTCTQSGSEGE